MFNVTGGELVIILLVALIVLGPDKLPDAIRKVGRVYGELRRMSPGFQSEIRDALDEPMREVRDTMNTMKSGFTGGDDPGRPRADPPAGTRMRRHRHGRRAAAARPAPAPAADAADRRRRAGGGGADRCAAADGRRADRRPAAGTDDSTSWRRRRPSPSPPANGTAAGPPSDAGAGRERAPREAQALVPRQAEQPDDRMTLVEHLGELRSGIIKSLLAVTLGALVMFLFYDPILDVPGPARTSTSARPTPSSAARTSSSSPGRSTASPPASRSRATAAWWWRCPSCCGRCGASSRPGLHRNEKKYAIPFIVSSVALFLFGAFIAYFTMPYAIEFLIGYSGPVTAAFTPNKYVSLLSIMMLAFGVGFLFPVLLVFLQLVGVVTPKQLSSWRRQAIVDRGGRPPSSRRAATRTA